VLLIHGFSGFNKLGPVDYFYGVQAALAEAGERDVFVASLPPFTDSLDRATVLARNIDEVLARTGAVKVHLVAHSQGGLDARQVVSLLGYSKVVATITSVGTPHRGTPLGDYVASLPEGTMDPIARVLAWLLGALDDPPPGVAAPDSAPGAARRFPVDLRRAAGAVSVAEVTHYNATHPDAPEVPIFTVAGISGMQRDDELCSGGLWPAPDRVDPMEPMLWLTSSLLAGADPSAPEPNDGIIPTRSQIYGQFLGCVPADHFDQIGQVADNLPQLVSGFDHREMYVRIVAHLRAWERTQGRETGLKSPDA